MEKLSVQFTQSHAMKCYKCKSVILEANAISQYIKYKSQQFYIPYKDKIPNTIIVQSEPKYSHLLMYLKNIYCEQCHELLGYQVYSVNEQTIFLLDHIIFKVSALTIGNNSNDITSRFIQHLEKWLKQEIEEEQNQKINCNQEINKQKKQTLIQSIGKKQFKQLSKNQQKTLKRMFKQYQKVQGYQIVKQIIQSLDFFSQVIGKIDQRVTDIEKACHILKKQVQKVVPTLRKNS